MEVKLIYATPINIALEAGLICTDSEDKIGNYDSKEFISKLVSQGHESIIEHINYNFRVNEISRACFDDKTEILTKNGYKFFDELNEDDLIATLAENDNIEYHNYNEYISYHYEGDMILGETTKFNFCVTPNHKMYVSMGYGTGSKKTKLVSRPYEFKNAEDILDIRGKFKCFCDWKGIAPSPQYIINSVNYTKKNNNDSFSERQSEERKFNIKHFLTFLGRYISDGNIYYNDGHYRITITDSIDKESELISIFTNLNYYNIKKEYNSNHTTCNISINDMTLFKWLEINVGKGSKNKKIPIEFLSYDKEYLNYLYEGLICGDGYRRTGWSDCFTTTSKILADQIQELVFKLGKTSIIKFNNRKTNYSDNFIYYTINIRSEKYNTPIFNNKICDENNKSKLKKVKYNGMVYCVNVPNHIVYVRRNGICMWAGNCLQELARHRHISLSVKSTRWALKKIKDKITFYHPDTKDNNVILNNLDIKIEEIKELLKEGIESGIPNDILKYYIPESLTTKLILTVNARELRHIFNLRTSNRALREFQVLCMYIYNALPEDHIFMYEDVYKSDIE